MTHPSVAQVVLTIMALSGWLTAFVLMVYIWRSAGDA